jgi:hypothetical protein
MASASPFSSPPSSRRSGRISSAPARYDEEQATIYLQQQEERQLQLALQESLELDDESDTDDDISPAALESEEEEEEKQESVVHTDSAWTTDIHTINLRPFSTPVGPTGLRRYHISPIDFFHLFLPLSLVQHISDSTNEYASAKNAVAWTSTSPSELYCFIGLLIYMGIASLPQLPMYWSSLFAQNFVTAAISRDRFKQLLRFFYVSAQAEQQQNTDKLKKVRWFSQQLQKLFSSYFNPAQVMTVDEAMVPFKGRSQMKQYIPQKPTKWGYKVWCLASDNYLLAFEIYEGKSGSTVNRSASDIVLSLTSPYQHRSHIVYLDRYFTSPTLLDHLAIKGIRACGTVRKDRVGLPSGFKTASSDLKQGQIKCYQRGELGALVWMDRRAVYLLTTHISPSHTTSIPAPDGSIQKSIPTAIRDYNIHKGGVDTMDQLRQSFSIGRKSKKWWPNLVWWLIDMCILNAYSLYNQQQQVKIRQLEFREQLMQQLVEVYGQQRSNIGRPSSISQQKQQQQHCPQRTNKERDCAYCSHEPDSRKQSRIQCELCHVHLCIDPCFKLYHTQH